MLPRVTPIALVAVFVTLLLANPSTAESHPSPQSFGISVRFVPEQARPGDVVQLRAQMDRETWGQFELHVPATPALHAITVEKMPLKYENGRYQQQQSLVFQPKRSGAIVISGARLDVVTSGGRQSVALPDLTLAVEPLGTVDTSDIPVPLPAPAPDSPPGSPALWAALVVIAFVLSITILLVAKKKQNRQLTAVQSVPPKSTPDDLFKRLQSGELPRKDLERLLCDPSFVASDAVRAAIERAVYSQNDDAVELAKLLQQQEAT